MRLTSLFLALAAVAPVSFVQAQEAPHDESVPHVHEAAKDPKDESVVDYMFRRSDEAFHDGDYPRAIGLHRAIVALDPSEMESWSIGAWLMWSLGNKEEALAFVADGLKANPGDPEMWDIAGQHYDLQKRVAESENAFSKAVELSGKDADQMLRRRYAHSAEHNGNWTKSAEIWRALVQEFPNDSVNRNNLVRVERTIAQQKTAPAQG